MAMFSIPKFILIRCHSRARAVGEEHRGVLCVEWGTGETLRGKPFIPEKPPAA